MPKPIATTVRQLHDWLTDHDPEVAARLIVGSDGVYDAEDLIFCERCRTNNLDEDITDSLCEPCRIDGEDEHEHQSGLSAMVRRL